MRKKTSTPTVDAAHETFFIARKGLGKEVSVRYSQAALKVLDVQKEQGTGTKNQFISDAIVEYGLAQYGVKKLGEEFANWKNEGSSANIKNPAHMVVVTALALTLLDGSFNKEFEHLCKAITEKDIAKLKGQDLRDICNALANKYQRCTDDHRKPLWALAFWAVKKGWPKKSEE